MRMMLRIHIDAAHGSAALKSEERCKRRSERSSKSSSRKRPTSASKAGSEPGFSFST